MYKIELYIFRNFANIWNFIGVCLCVNDANCRWDDSFYANASAMSVTTTATAATTNILFFAPFIHILSNQKFVYIYVGTIVSDKSSSQSTIPNYSHDDDNTIEKKYHKIMKRLIELSSLLGSHCVRLVHLLWLWLCWLERIHTDNNVSAFTLY